MGGAALALAGVFAAACATPVLREGSRWRARDVDASVAAFAEPGWEPMPQAGALLAYQGPRGERIAWLHQCRGAAASARAEAGALLVRLEGAALEREGALRLAGCDAHGLVGSAFEAGRHVAFESVTRVGAEACVDDFVLVAPDLDAARPAFERWWTSFAARSCE